MQNNMGLVDRGIRVGVAIIIALLYLFEVISGALGLILLVLAAVFVITSLLGFCPLYLPFNFNTNKKK